MFGGYGADVSQGELAAIAAALVAACITDAVLARCRAPAVSLGLAAAAVTGVIGFFVSPADGPRGVPQDVVLWASGGLAVFGLLGLIFLPGRASAA